MKTQKRDRAQRAYSRGQIAGIRGHSEDDCPYAGSVCRGNWFAGWRKGREHFIDGFVS